MSDALPVTPEQIAAQSIDPAEAGAAIIISTPACPARLRFRHSG